MESETEGDGNRRNRETKKKIESSVIDEEASRESLACLIQLPIIVSILFVYWPINLSQRKIEIIII